MGEVVLGLDVGESRIGVARAVLGSSFAFGRGFLERRGGPQDVVAVKELALREGAARVVVGLPRRTDGGESAQTAKVREFAEALAGSGLDVVMEDERFTTRIATEQMRAGGAGRRKRRQKGLVDEASAVLILETYLRRSAGNGS